MYINMAVKVSIGGWKDNAYIFKFAKVYSTFQKNNWSEFQVFSERIGLNA